MLQYSGFRFEYGVKLIVIGDGLSKRLDVDLRKDPFGFSFSGNFPRAAFVREADGERPTCSVNDNGILTLTYETALPIPMQGSLTPRSQLQVVLLFESIAT
jgi:hypothetical protein